jgi:glycosyltransferase involved in cell wall biosynthesis
LARADKIEVIPCCVDFTRYAGSRNGNATADKFEVVYAGSVTGLYLLEEMAAFFIALQAHKPRAFLRILSTSSADEASARLLSAGLAPDDFWIGSVSANEVPSYLRQASLGLSFRKSTFSQLAASPTKIPEYLAAGLPVVSNAGIGDVDTLLDSQRVGVVVHDFTATEFERASKVALQLVAEPGVRSRCEEVARRNFDVKTIGASGYINVYQRLLRVIAGENFSG